MRRSKRYRSISENLSRTESYPLAEAVDMVKRNAQAKFDETVELIATLGIDPKKADQQVRGTVSLPHGTGQTVRIVVFAEGEERGDRTPGDAVLLGELGLTPEGHTQDVHVLELLETPSGCQ